MPLDNLLGEERPHGQTPLELATVADMALEIGTRSRGQPAVLIYDHGDGRWPCRMGPGVSSDVLRKFAKILMTVAEQRREMDAGRTADDRQLDTPWGSLRQVKEWPAKRAAVLKEREFEIRLPSEPESLAGEWRWMPFVLGAAFGLAAAAAAKLVLFFTF